LGESLEVDPVKVAEVREAREKVAARKKSIDDWHNKMCSKIGDMRKENGPPPDEGSLPTLKWLLREVEIVDMERWVDYVHERRGDSYIRPRDRFKVIRIMTNKEKRNVSVR